jgi:hypothetical protein
MCIPLATTYRQVKLIISHEKGVDPNQSRMRGPNSIELSRGTFQPFSSHYCRQADIIVARRIDFDQTNTLFPQFGKLSSIISGKGRQGRWDDLPIRK